MERTTYIMGLVVVLLTVVCCFGTLAVETGGMRITCKPGVQIYVDDWAAGVTTKNDGGLFVGGIDPGTHKVRGENFEFGITIGAGKTTDIRLGNDGVPMVLIPAGQFQMGVNDGVDGPVHTVYLDAFYMDKYEVTNAQYKKFMDATGHGAPACWDDPNLNAPDQPVVGISWHNAKAYAEWAGKRLPTEAEWEKAARAGLTGSMYPSGDKLTRDHANYDGTGGEDRWEYTSPVGSFAPNGYGLYDMSGNVLEWCADWFSESYYSGSPKLNPDGPNSGTHRILRGGSWLSTAKYLRCARRFKFMPTAPFNSFGFRCATSQND